MAFAPASEAKSQPLASLASERRSLDGCGGLAVRACTVETEGGVAASYIAELGGRCFASRSAGPLSSVRHSDGAPPRQKGCVLGVSAVPRVPW
jgi:hypothetical protein